VESFPAARAEVDLSQLAIDRGNRPGPGARRHLLTRYVLPAILVGGFVALIAWMARDLVFPPRSVTVVPVFATHAASQREGTRLFEAAGWIESRPTPVKVAALAPGVVEKLLVVEDQPVKEGEPIAELVRADADLAHRQAQADLDLHVAGLRGAEAAAKAAKTRFEQPVHLDAVLGEAEAALAKIETQLASLPLDLQGADARLVFARQNYEGKLAAEGAVAGRIIVEARSQYESAKALAEELRGRADSLAKEREAVGRRCVALRTQRELKIDERRAKEEAEAAVQAATARRDRAQLSLEEAKLRLDRMTVRAPIDGRVLHLAAYRGSRLTAGKGSSDSRDGSTVVTLYQPDMLQVRVDVRFEDLRRVRLGQRVLIKSPAVASALEGKVLFLSSEADIQKNTLEVKVAIESPPPVLKPQMLVDATFLAPKQTDARDAPSEELRLFVPKSLVGHDDEGAFVWVADQSAARAHRTPVDTGTAGPDGLVEITKGLTPASRLIADGYENLRHGERIRVTGEAPPVPDSHDGGTE